jgi:uncharacterized protein YycO
MLNYDIQAGNILFYTSHSWADKLIQKFTNSEYTHVAIALDGEQCIAATTAGVLVQPINSPADVWSYRAHAIDNTDAHLQRGMRWLRGQLGTKYSWKDIISQVTSKLFGGAYVYSHREFDCSELATRFLINAGDFELPDDIGEYPNEVTPGSLHTSAFKMQVYRKVIVG